MNMMVHSDGPSTDRAASSTTIPGSAISTLVTQEDADSNHLP